ncbi:amino acid dehydrogenase [Conyzicola nivalis]|uniref:Leucine dehydrogenase n=1 Tax=Conyzicola nivalis TaxID=1477021 RepID=A0A916WLJ3_9MICO|nr:Glu/Leu/Phe/Val dehydrogenase [Conyzicola nivalis]GGB09410.1 leucine dehydrogenase [Conyzicola nivalis]
MTAVLPVRTATTTPLSFDHETVVAATGTRSGLSMVVAVHSTTLGPALGGCRLWSYDSWADGLADALRLSRGMTSKNALAGLDAGGGKSVIMLPAGTVLEGAARRDAFLDLGDLVESLGGSYRTAEDVATTSADMAIIAERTAHVVGLPTETGGHGDPAEYTARGVYAGLRETLRRATGSASVDGRRITVAGLGQVGSRLASRLAHEGAVLTVTDFNPARSQFAAELGATWVAPDEAHRVPADVFVPAGVGGMLSPAVIAELAATAVCGPANNQLAESDGDAQLRARGILYAPDYLVNAGGVIRLGDERSTDDEVFARIDAIERTLGEVFDESERSGVTSVEAADRLVAERLRSVAG